ncbi:putative arginine--tRNA ligase, mitochondrial [Tachypleus tridentatus]|uniref:putative arginine--tRNA ligase, mitochondrial n=1 Tax=Tachypleus tridentatus TaxID=6853 RepID=UPI003FD4B47A
MSTSFRRKVASMVTQCVSSVHKGLNTNVTEYVSKLLKVCPKKSHETQVWLAWKSLKDFDSTFLNLSSCDFVSLIKKELSENTTGEITGVNQLNDHQQHLVFVVDYKSFVKDTLQLSSRNMEKLSETSTLLSYIPHQKVVVEYSSPNIAKAFHVGHLRSTIIGSFIGNLHEFLGHDVTRLNYLGDWGTQCGLLFAGYQQFGSEDDLHQNPLYHLLRVYVMANKEAEKNSSFLDHAKHLFSQMENGNKAILTYWKKFRDLSIEEYNKVYNRLGGTAKRQKMSWIK